MMNGVAASARRLATAARVAHRPLVAASESRTSQLALAHARLLSTAQPSPVLAEQHDSRVVKNAYTRIVNKMVTLASAKNYEIGNVEERIESVVQYLERRLGMNRLTAIRTVALHPMLTAYTEDAMERKLAWFTRNGLDKDMLQTVVRRHPMILGRSEETFEATKQWLLDQGIAPSKIPFMFFVFPHAVSFAPDNLNSKVAYLQGLGLDDTKIRRVLQRFPQVMTGSIENMATKVDVAKSIGLTDTEIVKMITVVPEFLSLSMDEVKRKIRLLNELFGEGAAVRLWVASPRIVMCNPEQLRRTHEYLTKVVGMSSDRIASQVGLIMRNVDRLIRPRYEFLRKVDAPDLQGVRWISMTQSHFEERFPEYPEFLANEFKP